MTRFFYFTHPVLIASLGLILSCGGAVPDGAESPSETVASDMVLLTGRVDVPPLEAIRALQKRMHSIKNIKEAKGGESATGTKGDLYTLNGKHLGSFEANSEGEYQLEVPPEELAGNPEVILTTTSGIQKYHAIPYDSANSKNVNLGTADVVTTLATEGIIQQLEGFNDWGEDYSGADGDLACLYQIDEKLWTIADPDTENLTQKYGLLKQAVVSLIAQKKGSTDPDYDNWHQLLNALLTGKIDAPQALNMMNADDFDLASELTSADSGETGSGEAGDVYSTVEELLSALVAEDSTGVLCEGMSAGILDPSAVIAPILEADDLEELNAVYANDAAVKIHVELMQDCVHKDGCAGVKEEAETILEVMKAFDGDYEKMFDDDGKLDTAVFKGIVESAKTCESQKPDCIKEKIVEAHEKKGNGEPTPAPPEIPDDNPKVTICHIPPGNPANAHTIEIAASAWPAHLEHGDYEGECASLPPPPPPPPAEEKVTICHIPPDNPANPQTLSVAVSSWPAHLEHGDYEGTCVEGPPLSEITVLWNYTFGKIYGGFYRMIPGPSAAIGEVRPDLPGLEVATGNEEYYPLGSPGPSGRWFLFEADGTVVFRKNTENDEAHSSVNLYDLDDDGRLEMLGGTTSGNQVQAFDGEGNWFWRYILTGHSISTPTVTTLSSNGDPVVFNGCMDNYVRSIDGKTGALNWAFNSGRWIWSTPAVADLDGDNKKEVAIANDGQYAGSGVLYSLDAETGAVDWQTNLANKVHASPATADVDGDGVLEVLIGDGSGLFKAFDGETGELEWSFPTGGEILSSAAVGDLDGDGDLETVFGSADGRIYALNGDGSLFWKRYLGGAVHSSPALARRNPGSVLDVYVATMSGDLDILSGLDGSFAARLVVGYAIVSSPVVGDVDGDGKLEVFFQDRRADVLPVMAGDVFWAVRDEGSLVSPFAREWPLFRGNPAHTGVYHAE
ncbi:MAG: PQQ-binding-like beta-propeller repeat protein [Deltaproteobacteria bacterium]|nr:PQQ-binding-like beta-propeller repeat protein [Deltaproteobacteria bacterium]